MAWFDDFLVDIEPKSWRASDGVPASIKPAQVFLQQAAYGLEVAVAEASKRPTTTDMRKAWKARHGGRPSPVLLAVGYPGADGTMIALCGPAGDDPPVYFDLTPLRVERLAATALSEPTREAARRCLLRLLPEVESDLPGIVNSGLLATQELRHGVPRRSDWVTATKAGQGALNRRGRRLVEALGFTVAQVGANTSVLMGGTERRAVAVFLDEGETFDAPGVRFEGVSPVSHALAVADREHLSWVVLTRASEIRLYAARPDTGVGRRGPSQTFIEANVALLPDDLAGYLHLLFSADALADGGTFEQILGSSADFAADLAFRLRERVYRQAVPAVARAIASRLAPDPDEPVLAAAYDQTLNILFRLLFVAYGEDKDLLPYDTNSRYADHSLKRIARRLGEDINNGTLAFDDSAADLWEDVVQIWNAIDGGNKGWGIPPYNGGLFSADANTNPAGAALAQLRLTNSEFGPALTALLVDIGDSGETVGPVDFRSLSVREFGTIYEGLLESELSVAPTDLTVDTNGTYVPASRRQKIEIPVGTVYLHNRSGSRKATGSYFTKPFAVEHLLDHALEPALVDHLARIQKFLDAGDDAAAASVFFDFRCADIAMGSGHFLVAAVDRIEARLSAFLALNPISAITAGLDRLRVVAYDALGDLADGVEIETTSLLRRQIARRCIYGVDRNEIAVELSRLAIWIHTFVPGLPLSFLDHNLVVGDSLTGIGTIDEALGALGVDDAKTGTMSLMREEIEGFLDRASTSLRRLGTIADATVADVKAARTAHLEALKNVAPASALFDLLVAARLGIANAPLSVDEDCLQRDAQRPVVLDALTRLRALHFPVAFPEVFLRERPGFDCVLGNPPWETVKSEEHKFWGLRFPGLRSLPTGEMNREITRLRRTRPDLSAEYATQQAADDALRQLILAGPYPGLGAGDPDLSEVFAWRFMQLVAPSHGVFGVVLPRTVFMSKGTDRWRETLFASGQLLDLTTLVNSGGWVFDDVHQQWTVALTSYSKGRGPGTSVSLHGPFRSLAEFRAGRSGPGAMLSVEDILKWTPGAGIPLLPSESAAGVYRKIRAHPALVSAEQPWEVRTYNEFHSTADKVENGGVIDTHVEHPAGWWPVYKGESFSLWNPWTGIAYGWAKPKLAEATLQTKRIKQIKGTRSAFAGMPTSWAEDRQTLPCRHPRIAWRKVARATDTRSFYAALLPPNVLSADHNYLLFFTGDECAREEAYILGVMCSMPFDWHARLWVEANFTASIVKPFPIPSSRRSDRTRRVVEKIAGRLAAVDERYEAWAAQVGVPVGPVLHDQRPDLIAKLDAAVAVLYGLDEVDLRVIYDTFHQRADYTAHCERVLAHHRTLS